MVDEQHPLIVYIPTGVGGAPGGVAYGLKRVYKNAVHCFFAEPTLCPSVLLGFATNLYENVNVHDFGIDGLTEADGLVYSGCYVNARVELWVQDNANGKRINAKLLGIQFVRDGDAFGAGSAPAKPTDFSDLGDGDPASASVGGNPWD